ncbi:MAG: type II secretion system F family protein [Acidimicrobiia bacterium]
MSSVLGASVGVLLAGPIGAVVGGLAPGVWRRITRRRSAPETSITLVLLLVLVEIRSGLSVLAALIEVSDALPGYESLRRVARVARVSGLVASLRYADSRLRPVVAQLARTQRSGASLSGAVRRMLESELATDRARRIARARTLPVRLMLPVTLLMLPGLVLALYAPSLLGMFEDLTGVLT